MKLHFFFGLIVTGVEEFHGRIVQEGSVIDKVPEPGGSSSVELLDVPR